MKISPPHALGIGALLVAGGLVYLASRGVGPVKMPQFTELREGPLQEHLVTLEGLQVSRTFERHRWPVVYPASVAGGVSTLVQAGFTPLWQPADPQAAALPAEQAW
jgi:hypothetical protein